MSAPNAYGLQTATDPFSMLEHALWFALDAHPAVQSLVRVGNTVRWCGDRDPSEKAAEQAADMPELGLMPSGCRANDKNTSSTGGFTQRYTLAVNTGDMRTSGGVGKRSGLSQVKWAVLKALARYRAGIPDLPFVVMVRVGDANERIDMPGDEREMPPGWSAVIGIECTLQFPWSEIDA